MEVIFVSTGKRTYRYLYKEEKENCIKLYLEQHYTMAKIAKMYDINKGAISIWLRQYREHTGPWGVKEDQDAVMNRLFDQLHPLNIVENLEYWVKLEIENARLKKGYTVKGDGQKKEFVILSSRSFR